MRSREFYWIESHCVHASESDAMKQVREDMETTEEVLPELYKALKQKIDKHHWYPNTVILDNKSMVFAEGNSIADWKWSAVQSKDGKADMTTKKEFEERDFMEALDYIGYFNQQ